MEKRASVRKFLIATHGGLAEGVRSSLDLIVGPMENVFLIQAYLQENKPIEEELRILLQHREDEWVIFTDLLGGSITNQILRFVAGDGKEVLSTIHIVAGFNLPLLIEILLSDEARPLKEVIEDAITQAKDQLVYVNKFIAPTHKND